YRSLMSENAPTFVKVGDHVLPISTTSGVFAASGRAVVSLARASPHDCSSIVRVPPVTSAYSALRYSRSSSGVSPPISHRVRSGLASSSTGAVVEHPARMSIAAAAATTPSFFFMVCLPLLLGAVACPVGHAGVLGV